MKISEEKKKEIYDKYMAWVMQVSEDLEDKSVFHADEIVYQVLKIVEEVVE